MKTPSIKFGFSVVQSGQKAATLAAEPQMIACSTSGKFSITAPVSKALDIKPGDNIMVVSNFDALDNAIAAHNEDLVAYAEENGIDLTTYEGEQAIKDAFGCWWIAKGIAKFGRNGQPIMTAARMTKEDKLAYIKEHGLEVVEANRDALVEKFGEMSDEELVEKLTPEMIESPKVQAYEGSKTATVSNAITSGVKLDFTDTAIWTVLRNGCSEKNNRLFDVDLKAGENVKINNGYQDVDVVLYPISFKEDVQVAERKGNAEA